MEGIKGKYQLDTVLEERGWGTDLQFKKEDLKWDRLERVAKDFVDKIQQEERVLVLYDPDVDGLFSGYIIEDYLKTLGKKVERHMNKNKVHGLSELDTVITLLKEMESRTLIIPDASTNDIEELKLLEEEGITVYVLDHHEIEVGIMETEKIKVLNISEFDNTPEELPALSGCGVTYRFIEEVNKEFGKDITQYENLVGITVLSDVCDMTVSENRHYVNKLYDTCLSNPFFASFDFYGSYSSLISYKVVPFLNALIRIGETDKAMNIVNSMYSDRVIRRLVRPYIYSVKGKQQDMVDEIMEEGRIFTLKGMTVHIRQNNNHKEVNGLLANQLLGKYNQSCMVVSVDQETKDVSGSFRGLNTDYDILKRYGFDCRGHASACGVFINKEGFVNFLTNFEIKESELRDKTLKYVDVDTVASELLNNDVTARRIALFNEYKGNHVNPIRLRIKDFDKNTSEMIDKTNIREYYVNGIRIVDFNKSDSNDMIVEPVYDTVKGYQLLRV